MIRSRIVSLFCFTVFFVGTLQPALPMIEYFVFKQNIIEFFCEKRDEPENDCEGFCYLKNQIEANDSKQNHSENLLQIEKQLIYLYSDLKERPVAKQNHSTHYWYSISFISHISSPDFPPPDPLS